MRRVRVTKEKLYSDWRKRKRALGIAKEVKDNRKAEW
jgi:hypothetical protein